MTPRQLEVLIKYKIVLPDGSPRMTDLAELGRGPLIDDEALEALLGADTTPQGEWLDWIFFQAGGGQKAAGRREDAVAFVKEKFYIDQTEGFEHPVTHRRVAPRPLAEVDARWKKALPVFLEKLEVLDEDAKPFKLLDSFGYTRSLPGRERVYLMVVDAIKAYLAIASRAVESDVGVASPAKMLTWQALVAHTKAVIRFYAAKDVRYAGVKEHDNLVYDDPFISVIVPVTYPASVKYGHPSWRFSDPKIFSQVVSGKKPYHDWLQTVGGSKFYAFLNFKVPVPVQVKNKQQFSFTNLALELPMGKDLRVAAGDPDTWKVWDEQNRYELDIAAVKELIRSEPGRKEPETGDEWPILAGGPVVKTAEEAEEIVRHLDLALAALVKWAKTFSFHKFVPDLTQMPPG